jgi:hypothetical protein
MAQVSQLDAVKEITRDQQWRTLERIRLLLLSVYQINTGESDVATALRDLRKVKNGGLTVEKRFTKGRTYEYRVTPPTRL